MPPYLKIHIDACVFDSCVPPRTPEAAQKGASDDLVLDSAWQSQVKDRIETLGREREV